MKAKIDHRVGTLLLVGAAFADDQACWNELSADQQAVLASFLRLGFACRQNASSGSPRGAIAGPA